MFISELKDIYNLYNLKNIKWFLSVYQLNGVNQHQVSRLKRGTVLANFVGFSNQFLFFLFLYRESYV
jgi:hypothetical protein